MKNQNEWIEEVLNAGKGLHTPPAPDHLWEGITKKIAALPAEKRYVSFSSRTTRIAIGVITVLLLINIAIVFGSIFKPDRPSPSKDAPPPVLFSDNFDIYGR